MSIPTLGSRSGRTGPRPGFISITPALAMVIGLGRAHGAGQANGKLGMLGMVPTHLRGSLSQTTLLLSGFGGAWGPS